MAKIDTNIDKLYSLTKEFDTISAQYNKIISEFFELMQKTIKNDDSWVNCDANLFLEYCKIEKKEFNLVGEEFLNYTNLLRNTTERLLKACVEISK